MKTLLIFLLPCMVFADGPENDIHAFESSYLNGALRGAGHMPVEILGTVDDKIPEGFIVKVSKIRHCHIYRDMPDVYILIINSPQYSRKFINETIVESAGLTDKTHERRAGYRPIPVYDASKGR